MSPHSSNTSPLSDSQLRTEDASGTGHWPEGPYVFPSSQVNSLVGTVMSQVQENLSKLPSPGTLHGANYQGAQAAFAKQFREAWGYEPPECLSHLSEKHICSQTYTNYKEAMEPTLQFWKPYRSSKPFEEFPRKDLEKAREDLITYIESMFSVPCKSDISDSQKASTFSDAQLAPRSGKWTSCGDLESFKQTIMSHKYTGRVKGPVERLQRRLADMRDPRELTAKEFGGARAAFGQMLRHTFGESLPSYLQNPTGLDISDKTKEEYGDALCSIVALQHPYKSGQEDFDKTEMEQIKEDVKHFAKDLFGDSCPTSKSAGDTKADSGTGTDCHCIDGDEGWGSVFFQQNWKRTIASTLGTLALGHVLYKTLSHARQTLLSEK